MTKLTSDIKSIEKELEAEKEASLDLDGVKMPSPKRLVKDLKEMDLKLKNKGEKCD